MSAMNITHFVFVDFENVQKMDLAALAGKPVHVTLLIGKNQKKLDTSLSLQLHQYAAQVKPIEVGSSGHNALDLTLAYYLGVKANENPLAQFHIVSKDKDFEPLIAHLQSKAVRVARCDAFAELPFLAGIKKSSSTKSPFATKAPPAKPKAVAKAAVDKYPKLLEQVRSGKHRPGTRAKLMHHIHTLYGQKSTPEQLTAVIDRLIKERIASVGDDDKVSYL